LEKKVAEMSRKCRVSTDRHKKDLKSKHKEVERFQKEIKSLKIQKEKNTVPVCSNC
jgi:hypothetical protein